MSFWTRLFKGSADESYENGIRLFNDGHYDEAVAILEDVISSSDSHGSPIAKLGAFYAAEAHAKIGIAHFYRGQLSEAYEHFDIAITENPHYADLYYYIGVVNHHDGRFEEAIERFEKAIELNPEYAEAVCYLGITLHDAGYFDRANSAFSRALLISRRAPHPLSRILVEKLEAKSFDVPLLNELREIVIESSSLENWVKEGTVAFNRGDFDIAVEMFGSAANHKPEYPDLHCKLGISLLEAGRLIEAIDALKKAVEINENYVDARYYLGIAYFSAGDYKKSREHLGLAREGGGEYADVHCQYGVACLTLGEFEMAQQAFENALRVSPQYAKAHYLRGLAFHALGENGAASESLKRSLSIKPDLFAAQVDTGLHSASLGEWDDARRHFERVAENSETGSGRAEVLCMLGSACLEMGRVEQAKSYLREAAVANPGHTEAKKTLALAHCRDEDFEAAEKIVREAIEAHDDYADLHKILGDVLLKKCDAAGAESAYRKSLAINPHFSDAVCGAVVALRRDDRGSEADSMLRDYVDTHPSDLMARTLMTVDKMKMPDA